LAAREMRAIVLAPAAEAAVLVDCLSGTTGSRALAVTLENLVSNVCGCVGETPTRQPGGRRSLRESAAKIGNH